MIHLTTRRMEAVDLAETSVLLTSFINSDVVGAHRDVYGGDADASAVDRALALFLEHPNMGFVWIAREGSALVGLAVVCLAVSTNIGGLVAKLPDVVVAASQRGRGIGALLMTSLADELRAAKVRRIDLGVHDDNSGARRFYERLGFAANHEIGMSLVL